MITMLGRYLQSVVQPVPGAWSRFWFESQSTLDIALVRVAFGIWSMIYVISWWSDLPALIATGGLLPVELARYLIGAGVPGTGSLGRVSLLYVVESPWVVQAYLAVAWIVSLALTLGLGGRWLALGHALLMLGIAHRMPMLQGPGAAWITGMLLYLAVDPGKLERWWKPGLHDHASRVTARLGLRLVQVHVLMWLVVSLLSALAEPMWWSGVAAWWLAENGRSPWFRSEVLSERPYLVNLLTYGYLFLQVALIGTLVRRGLRSIAILLSVSLAVMTWWLAGDAIYALALVAAAWAFAGAAWGELTAPEGALPGATGLTSDITSEVVSGRSGQAVGGRGTRSSGGGRQGKTERLPFASKAK
jgi:hypothetical protein